MAVFKTLSLSSIFIGERVRPVDEDHAQAIAASMAERGLINPITVRSTPARKGTPYTLVAGGHRHRAAVINEWAEIDTVIVEADAVEAQLMELSENLYRNELSALDRAIFVMKFREIWEEKNGEIKRGGNTFVSDKKRSKGHDDPSIFSNGRELAQRVKERFGFAEKTYKRTVQIARNLHPSLRQAVRGTLAETDQSKLLKLARLSADDQLRAAAALNEDRDIKHLFALIKGSKPATDPQDGLFFKLVGAWDSADGDTRRRFLDHIGGSADFSFLEAAQ